MTPPGPPVDFWWLKPSESDPSALEEATLHRHAKGIYKNDPGASRKVYGPIAALFASAATSSDGLLRFGVVTAAAGAAAAGGNGDGRPRAYIECVTSGVRYYLCWVWLEDWSSPVSFGKKFMKGKLIYQKALPGVDDGSGGSSGSANASGGREFFARPFHFVESLLKVPAGERYEEAVHAVLPTDHIKFGCDV